MKLEQLRYLSEAIKYQSISIAAEHNFISQPSFSGAITKLEQELGAQLLRRSSKGVTPTESGLVVLKKAEQIFELLDSMSVEISQARTQGTVRLSAIVLFYNYFVPKIISKMQENGYVYTLDTVTAESAKIAMNVSQGIDNLGIVFYSESLIGNNLEFVPLFEDESVLFVGKESPYWNAESITIEEALEQPYIAYRGEFRSEDDVWTEALGKNLRPNICFRTDDLELLKKVIAQSNYVAFFSKRMSKDDFYLQQGVIRAIPISNHKISVTVGYIYNKKYKLTTIDKLFLDLVESVIKEEL